MNLSADRAVPIPRRLDCGRVGFKTLQHLIRKNAVDDRPILSLALKPCLTPTPTAPVVICFYLFFPQ